MCIFSTKTSVNGNFISLINRFNQFFYFVIIRTGNWLRVPYFYWFLSYFHFADVAGQDYNGYTAFINGGLCGLSEYTLSFFRLVYHLAENACILIDLEEIHFLRESGAHRSGGQLTGNNNYWCIIAVGFV